MSTVMGAALRRLRRRSISADTGGVVIDLRGTAADGPLSVTGTVPDPLGPAGSWVRVLFGIRNDSTSHPIHLMSVEADWTGPAEDLTFARPRRKERIEPGAVELLGCWVRLPVNGASSQVVVRVVASRWPSNDGRERRWVASTIVPLPAIVARDERSAS